MICSVKSESETSTFHWLRNKESLISSEEIRIRNDIDFSVLVIEPVNSNSTGNYTCLARNDLGEDSFSAFLQVEGNYHVTIFFNY